MLINKSGTKIDVKRVHRLKGLSKPLQKSAKAFLLGAAYCWCKNRKGKPFSAADIVGGHDADWSGTPLMGIRQSYLRHKDQDAAEKLAGVAVGWLLRDALEESNGVYAYMRTTGKYVAHYSRTKLTEVFMAVVFLVFSFSACAAVHSTWIDEEQGVTWNFVVENEEVIVGCGEFPAVFDWGSRAILEDKKGALKIPSKLDGYPVTKIGDSAFYDCSGLTSVTIPDGVKNIGNAAFECCSGLASVVIPSSVTRIGTCAFDGCSRLMAVTIPSGVMTIGLYAFAGCTGLTSVMVPPSVTEIGSSAFSGCSNLTSVTLPFVGSQRGNSDSTSAVFGYIFGTSSYDGAIAVKQRYTAPPPSGYPDPSVTYYIPSSLRTVKITDETKVGYGAFCLCSRLTSITISSSVTNIGENAFSGCNGLTEMTIPSSVTDIGAGAFSGCSKLTEIAIPSGVTSIEESAFAHCTGLTSVTIPSDVTNIAKRAFQECSGLISVAIPSSVTNIGGYAFLGCSGLTSISVEANNPSYSSQSGILYDKTKSVLICCPAGKAGAVTIPSGVMNIGLDAFCYCSSLTEVSIPSSVTSLEMGAFCYCSSLTEVSIPSSVTSIGGGAFYACDLLTVVHVNKGDAERVKKLYQWPGDVQFVEIPVPAIEGDEGAMVTGDAETGFVIKPSEGKTAVEVTIPQGVDAAKVTVEVSVKVTSVKPNGANVKVVNVGADITEFLNVPAADGNGVVDLTKATVKEEIVKEAMDVEKGAKIELDASNPSLTTPNTRKGLFYQFREGETLAGMKNGDSKVGDGQPWSPEIKVKGGNSAFYAIGVGKGE